MATQNDTCEVCGLSEFILEDGFYYCTECGTKLLSKREIAEDDTNVGNHTNIRHEIGVENKITSWEQMNYFLHGLTERLIELGAPEELKTTVLQIWCAYLKMAEIAFFHKRQRKRPRLPLRNKKWDLKLLFNRDLPRPAKRKAKQENENMAKRVRSLNRDILKTDQDALTQSQHSDLESTLSTLSTSMQSSSNSAQGPLAYEFNSRARKHLLHEFKLPEEHIEWHELEAPPEVPCHPFPYSAGKLDQAHLYDNWSFMHRKTVLIAILSIALNQVRSSIQIADLIRWSEEGHLAFHDLRQYLPEDLHAACYSETVAYLTTTFQGFIDCRVIVSLMAADLGIVPIQPDMSALCRRFLSELALPLDLEPFVAKVIAISPTIGGNNVYNYFPKYEAHAMKYILFVMKLLFGLDGVNETKLDDASEKLNRGILTLANLPKLFVWSEWQQYVTMRRVILEQVHYPTNHSRTQSIVHRPVDNDLLLHFFESRIVPDADNTTGYKAGINRPTYKTTQERLFKNLHTFIASATEKHEQLYREHSKKKHITFDHSLQPQRSYLAELLNMEEAERNNVHIPAYMLTDHSERTVAPLVNPMSLKKHLLTHHRVRLTTKKIKPSLKHIRMAKYNSNLTNVELYLAANKFAHVVYADGSDSSDSEDSNVESNILDYINSRAAANQPSPEELFHQTVCQNLIDEMEANLRAEELEISAYDADLSWIHENPDEIHPFENNPPIDGVLPGEQDCRETAQIAVSNFHYWVSSGNLKDVSSDTFEREYFALFPPSFQFLLREAAYVTRLSMLELYHELNELEKHFFKTYRRIK